MLIAQKSIDEMIALCQMNGVMCQEYPWSEALGCEHVFNKTDTCRTHSVSVGLCKNLVDQYIR